MKRNLFTILSVIVIVSTIAIACQKEFSCEGCLVSNKSPIAVAGPDQLITLPTDSVLLNGSASYDQDGKIAIWRWSKIVGPGSFNIRQLDTAKSVAGKLILGIYYFELMVTDDQGASARDTVQLTVNAASNRGHPPVACAGQDQTISLPLNSVMLDGSCSTDPDSDIASYFWTKISGPSSFSIANANAAKTQVTKLVEGSFLFQLKVADADGLFTMDTVQVIVNTQTENSLVDIYVTGQENGVAKYWKNGQAVLLNGPTVAGANSIAINGGDIYVAGWAGNGTESVAKYWKNGQEVLLTGPTGAGAISIAVNGGDIYIAGWTRNGSVSVAKYWKNGQAFSLSDGLMVAQTSNIVFAGGDVYVAGYEVHDNNHTVAKYWKNGQAFSLTDGSHQSYAHSIVVVGNDIYVAGSEVRGTVHIAKYWKNGQPVLLTDGSDHAYATSITVVGNDVYVCGREGGNFNSVAKYWKNGQVVSLTDGSNLAYANSIAVFGSDVYVAGNVSNGVNRFVAKYWKNGKEVILAGGNDSWATCILVVPR